MVIRRIQGLYRSSSGYVTGVCNPAEPWASRTVGDVVADISWTTDCLGVLLRYSLDHDSPRQAASGSAHE